MRIVAIYLSPGHNFLGQPRHDADLHPTFEVPEVECVAGSGLRGDRFLNHKTDYKGQITFFAEEIYESLCTALDTHDKPRSVLRRNVITRGVDLNSLIGKEFVVQGVTFRGASECSPCQWMDYAFAPGAEKFLRGRGGLRARIVTSGPLRVDDNQ